MIVVVKFILLSLSLVVVYDQILSFPHFCWGQIENIRFQSVCKTASSVVVVGRAGKIHQCVKLYLDPKWSSGRESEITKMQNWKKWTFFEKNLKGPHAQQRTTVNSPHSLRKSYNADLPHV